MPRTATNADAFNAIAEQSRRELLGHLAVRESSVNQLVESMGTTQPQVSKHLRVLREVGLVNVRQEGRLRWYRLNADQLKPIFDWVQTFERFWDQQLAGVKAIAEANAQAAKQKTSEKKKEIGY
jgi:DNA-binding transcriptional ArsR family regulator